MEDGNDGEASLWLSKTHQEVELRSKLDEGEVGLILVC